MIFKNDMERIGGIIESGFKILGQGIKDVWFLLEKMEMYLIVWLDINTSFPWCETITILLLSVFAWMSISWFMFMRGLANPNWNVIIEYTEKNK